jgi:hypothetical protein
MANFFDSLHQHNFLFVSCDPMSAPITIVVIALVATLALGSRPRQKGCKVVARGSPGAKARESPGVKARGSPGVTSHTPGSVRKCEGVNPHIPKATPTLGDGVSVNFRNFRE